MDNSQVLTKLIGVSAVLSSRWHAATLTLRSVLAWFRRIRFVLSLVQQGYRVERYFDVRANEERMVIVKDEVVSRSPAAPEETMTVKTVVLEKIRRSAQVLVSRALLDSAELSLVADEIGSMVIRAMFTVEALGKSEKQDWTTKEDSIYIVAPGIWNNIKELLNTQWPFTLGPLRVVTTRIDRWTTHHHAIYHMCPHVNEWVNTKMAHLKWLESVPRPEKSGD